MDGYPVCGQVFERASEMGLKMEVEKYKTKTDKF